MCYCPTPTLHLNLALTGDFVYFLILVFSMFFKSFGLRGGHRQCPHKPPSCCNTHVSIQICVLKLYIHQFTHGRWANTLGIRGVKNNDTHTVHNTHLTSHTFNVQWSTRNPSENVFLISSLNFQTRSTQARQKASIFPVSSLQTKKGL